jgi:hypothetical protein
MRFRFSSELWQWQARSDSWFFVTMPPDQSDELRDLPHEPRGFRSVRVRATIGETTWGTSVFPDAQRSGGYVLPVKKSVREAEGIVNGDVVDVQVEVGL